MIIGDVLRSDYGIDQIYGGCIVREKVDCYAKTMYSLLQQKYGPQFYLRVREKAEQVWVERRSEVIQYDVDRLRIVSGER